MCYGHENVPSFYNYIDIINEPGSEKVFGLKFMYSQSNNDVRSTLSLFY